MCSRVGELPTCNSGERVIYRPVEDAGSYGNLPAGAFGWAVNELAGSRRVILIRPVNACDARNQLKKQSLLFNHNRLLFVVLFCDLGRG